MDEQARAEYRALGSDIPAPADQSSTVDYAIEYLVGQITALEQVVAKLVESERLDRVLRKGDPSELAAVREGPPITLSPLAGAIVTQATRIESNADRLVDLLRRLD